MNITFEQILTRIDDFVWGLPLIILILGTGIFLTIKLNGLQFSKLALAIKLIFKKDKSNKGEVSSFATLCTSLSVTIGIGNIVGVATAIVAGGPGALFWMWIAALFGMVTKYAECMLSIHYRDIGSDGHVLGGPFYTIEKGMGHKWKWLSILFAIFGMLAGLLGIGTTTQVNSITDAVKTFFDPNNLYTVSILGRNYSWAVIITSITITVSVAIILIGGIKRIASVSQFLVPFMALIYVGLGILIIILNITKVPTAFMEIIKGAFGLKAVAGGALGAMFVTMQKGIARGIFSNEAGLGSAPIAASAAQSEEPVEQGLISMMGTFIDTIVICTITGIAVVLSGEWDSGLQGFAVTNNAFCSLLPINARIITFLLMLCLVLFAFTSILGWDYYSERCIEYISGGKMKVVKACRWLYIIAVFIGPFMTINVVWTVADIFNGLMAIPNIISLLALSGMIVKMTKEYFVRKKL